MIGFLSGQPKITSNNLIMIVGGVGYLVHVGNDTLHQLQDEDHAELYTHTHVREDSLELYGFLTRQDQQVFNMLNQVSGVGPKTALNIVDGKAAEVITAVQQADTPFFTAVPRVGKKVAQKIIIELRGKLGEMKSLDLGPLSAQRQEVLEALQGLGFASDEIEPAMKDLDVEDMKVEEAIKQVIKKLRK